MNPPERPTNELVELHRLFLDMRRATADVVRRRLAFEIVLHSSGQMRLKAACGAVLLGASHDFSLRSDILQEATLLMVERLTPPCLAYLDEGADRFGGWLYTMCRRCCLDAWHRERPAWVCATLFVDPNQLLDVAAPPQRESLRSRLLRMIGTLEDPQLRSVLLDCVAGFSVSETADRLALCPRTVDRLRSEGREMLRRIAAEELVDEH
jgi:DNA-directed RNA polymerase specialized sigma24 family protein